MRKAKMVKRCPTPRRSRAKKNILFKGESWHVRAFAALVPDVLKAMAKSIRQFERRIGVRFDVFAGLGVSGTVPAALLAQHMKRGLLIVRQLDVRLQSGRTPTPVGVAPSQEPKQHLNYLVIDDLISSGGTIKYVVNAIMRLGGAPAGIFLYDSYDDGTIPMHRCWYDGEKKPEPIDIPRWSRNFGWDQLDKIGVHLKSNVTADRPPF